MDFFEYARDYYGDWLPARLLPAAGLLILWIAVLFLGIHLVRRSKTQPVSTDAGPGEQLPGESAEKYERNARLYHWGNAFLLLTLVLSGVALFAPGAVRPLRISWLHVHEIAAVLFIVGLVLHIIVAPRKGRGHTMWFERRDWRDIRIIVANFMGRTRAYPAFGKYDPFQKLYHATLTVLSAVMVWSGVFLFISAEIWATFGHPWLRWQRLLHDLGAFGLMAVVLGHMYFGLIRVNWPSLKAMITGRLSAGFFNRYHTTTRWQPEEPRDD